MSTAPDKATQTQIANIEKTTGKKMEEWVRLVRASAKEKHGELVSWLKEQYGFTHGNANLVVHLAKQSHAGAAGDQEELVISQYQGKENLKPLYEAIIEAVRKMGDGLEIAPKKAYVSLRRKKQFALVQPSTKERLDIGLNIKGEPPAGIAIAAGSWNAMCTHRIKLENGQQLTKEIISWIQKAWEQAG